MQFRVRPYWIFFDCLRITHLTGQSSSGMPGRLLRGDGAAQFSGLAKLNLLDYTDARLERVTEALGGTAERANWNADHYGRLAVRLGQTIVGLRDPVLYLTLSATPARCSAMRPPSWMECAA